MKNPMAVGHGKKPHLKTNVEVEIAGWVAMHPSNKPEMLVPFTYRDNDGEGRCAPVGVSPGDDKFHADAL